jgi:DNA repair exonuclease SbcCD ATPase subunit
MKIIELQAENVKRLKAVDITPDEHLQIIGGRNAQGKSSVLDAVALALTGKDARKLNPRPLRDGERKGRVSLNLGEYVVTRTFTENGGGTLSVSAANGAKFTSPQKLLDGLMGRLSFDPQEFIGLSAKEQSESLLGLVQLPIDLDATDAEIARLEGERLIKGRDLKTKGDYAPIDTDAPAEEMSATELLDAIQSERGRNHEIAVSRLEAEATSRRIAGIVSQIAALQAQLAEARDLADKQDEMIRGLGEPHATDDLEAKLANIENLNARVRANRDASEHNAQIDMAKGEYDALSQRIEALRESKSKALSEAEFPIDGLGFDDSGVTYNGVPFAQASGMEQLRVSLAIAMASNPTLRVIRIKDGSLLDDEALALVAKTAEDNDYQVLMERVGAGDHGAIIIEDGMVLEAEAKQ